MIRLGGFGAFERIMAACVVTMVIVVAVTAVLMRPDWGGVAKGLLVPTIPNFRGEGLGWTVGLMGGVGGTVTILCYSYWMREAAASGPRDIRTCRLDIGVGYLMTALFGIALVIIANGVDASGSGAGLIVALADELAGPLGSVGRWVFLIGAAAAVFSSLLGVWQAVPYIFADFWGIVTRDPSNKAGAVVDTTKRPYRIFQYCLAFAPLLAIQLDFREVQKYYAIAGAFFIPLLAAALLILNSTRRWIGDEHRYGLVMRAALALCIALFGIAGYFQISRVLG